MYNYVAQQLGLEPKPPEPLSTQQWKDIASKAKERKDSLRPCPICREEFGVRDQVRADFGKN